MVKTPCASRHLGWETIGNLISRLAQTGHSQLSAHTFSQRIITLTRAVETIPMRSCTYDSHCIVVRIVVIADLYV